MKKFLLLEINTITKFYCEEWNMLWLRVVYLADTYWHHIITSLSQCVNELIHLFIVFNVLWNLQEIERILNIASFKQWVSCILFSKFFKPIHYILLNNFIRMIDVPEFVHDLCLFDLNICSCSIFNLKFIKIHVPRSHWPPKVNLVGENKSGLKKSG